MRFFLYSPEGVGLAIAHRLQLEGNKVEVWTEKDIDHVFQGIVPKVKSLEEGLSHKPDVIIFDYCKSGEVADDLRKKGFRVLGGSKFQDMIELDRLRGMQIAERLGIPVPPYQSFGKKDLQKAIEFVAETQERYVLKPNGNASAALTYVSSHADDMIQELEHIEREGLMKDDFILQTFIPGVEISTEGWYAKGKRMAPFNGTLEQKHLLAGDLGPNTGCESSVVWGYHNGCKIADLTLVKLDPILKKMEYTGPLDINCIISEEDGKPYFLEYTPRFGYSAFYAFTEILDQDVAELLFNAADGNDEEIPMKEDVGVSLTISMPPYPLEPTKETKFLYEKLRDRKIINPPDGWHWWPADAMLDKEDNLVCAGTDGLIGFITAAGNDLDDVSERIYDMAKEIEVSDKGYRTDLDDRVIKNFPRLIAAHYEVPNLTYSDPDEKPQEVLK